MENREILVANTKTQKRYKLTTDATTLGELKAAMSAANIDYYDMTFTEGISKTQLLDDATQLPHDIMYKGSTTNNLVILLTNTKKNIASGSGSRQEAYNYIKENNLQNLVKDTFGKNFTMVSNDSLWNIIEQHKATTATPQIPLIEKEKPATPVKAKPATPSVPTDNTILDSLKATIISLLNINILTPSAVGTFADEILDYLDEKDYSEDEEDDDDDWDDDEDTSVSTSDGAINDDDINDMLNELDI